MYCDEEKFDINPPITLMINGKPFLIVKLSHNCFWVQEDEDSSLLPLQINNWKDKDSWKEIEEEFNMAYNRISAKHLEYFL